MRKFTDRDHRVHRGHRVLGLLVIRPFTIKCLTSQTSRRHKRWRTGIKRHAILFDCHRGFAKIPYHTKVGVRLITTGLPVMPIKIIALALVCGLLCGPAEATGTQIWLAGVDPVVRAGPDAQTASDYLKSLPAGCAVGQGLRSCPGVQDFGAVPRKCLRRNAVSHVRRLETATHSVGHGGSDADGHG